MLLSSLISVHRHQTNQGIDIPRSPPKPFAADDPDPAIEDTLELGQISPEARRLPDV
jgi:hypothetical protein